MSDTLKDYNAWKELLEATKLSSTRTVRPEEIEYTEYNYDDDTSDLTEMFREYID